MLSLELSSPRFSYPSIERNGAIRWRQMLSHSLFRLLLLLLHVNSTESTWVPAAYKLLQHHGHPIGHHRWYPTCHHGIPPPVLQSSPFPQLNAMERLHLCFKKGKKNKTEQDRDKAHLVVKDIELFTSQSHFWDSLVPFYHFLPSKPSRNINDCKPQQEVPLVQGWLFNWLLQWPGLCCL